MDCKELLVVMPHSGILIPEEIPLNSLSKNFPALMKDVDWYTNWLYDFRDILGNSQLEFPYCSLLLEANRDPDNIDESVPLKNRLGEPLYQPGMEPAKVRREALSRKYLLPFHQRIGSCIVQRKKSFMLDAHSTVTGRGVTENQIELMNYQVSAKDTKKTCFCPDFFIDIYASELNKRLPGIKVTVNQSEFDHVYGHVCGKHSINAAARRGTRVPAILQETNQKLYLNMDGTPNTEAIETLRRAFAGALACMIEKVNVDSGSH